MIGSPTYELSTLLQTNPNVRYFLPLMMHRKAEYPSSGKTARELYSRLLSSLSLSGSHHVQSPRCSALHGSTTIQRYKPTPIHTRLPTHLPTLYLPTPWNSGLVVKAPASHPGSFSSTFSICFHLPLYVNHPQTRV